VQFFVLGFTAGIWGVHIPSVKARYGLSEATLSLVLLTVALGAMTCLFGAGKVVARLGARATTLAAAWTLFITLSWVVVPDSAWMLIPLVFVFGGAGALFDVAINAEGTLLESLSGKKVMSGFHAMFSVGGMAGAGVGAALLARSVPPWLQLAGSMAVLTVPACIAAASMLPAHPQPEQHAAHHRPRGTLMLLGVLAALGLLAEGALYDWSVLYMQKETGAVPALAALGYASFAAAMAATRFAGDFLRTHLSQHRLFALSGVLAAAAMAAVLLIREPLAALCGFALVGAGLANVVPMLFAAASHVRGVTPAAALAAVSSVGYLGFVAGPPLVGTLAHALSLSWALTTVVVASLLLAWGARRLPN
jgi:predicted MFS family arabinose efflux permease